MRRLNRAAPVFALGMLSAALLGGCVFPTACTAIGWSNNLVVSVDAALDPVSEVRICIDADCISSAGRATPDPPVELLTSSIPTARSANDPPPSSTDLSGGTFASRDGKNWIFVFIMRSPDALTVQVVGADGVVLRSLDASLDWVRVGGDERCGGPSEAKVSV